MKRLFAFVSMVLSLAAGRAQTPATCVPTPPAPTCSGNPWPVQPYGQLFDDHIHLFCGATYTDDAATPTTSHYSCFYDTFPLRQTFGLKVILPLTLCDGTGPILLSGSVDDRHVGPGNQCDGDGALCDSAYPPYPHPHWQDASIETDRDIAEFAKLAVNPGSRIFPSVNSYCACAQPSWSRLCR